MRDFVLALLLLSLGAGGAYSALYFQRQQPEPPKREPAGEQPARKSESGACARHELAACPFCDESLIEKMGLCPGHEVPEALCSRCNPALISAFKAENDWCAGHEVPESQCRLCGASPVESAGKAMCGKHSVPAEICPFCDESLIEKMGLCPGHEVPEALCSRCNPALIPAFKAENDWCAGHEVPESQCRLCQGGG